MRTVRPLTRAPAALLALALAGSSAAQDLGPQTGPDVRARLVTEEAAARLGGLVHVGLTFEVEAGWHLYWKNPGDSGGPIRVELELPEGFERAGEWRWPAPERLVLPGGLVNYAYEDEVTLVAPVRVAESVAAGTEHRLAAAAEWLVCREACLPGHDRVSATVRVVEGEPEPSADAPLFAAARRRLPREPAEDEVHRRWEGRTLVLEAPGAQELAYFPYEPVAIAPEDARASGRVEGSRLEVTYPARAEEQERFSGVLEVHRGEEVTWLRVTVPGPGAE